MLQKIALFSLYFVLLLFIFFGLPDRIIYAQKGTLMWLPLILLFIFQPFLIYLIARSFSLKSYPSKGVAALVVIVTSILFGVYCTIRQEKSLQTSGKIAIGVVYKKWFSTRPKREWLIRCHFQDNKTTYSTFSEIDERNIYRIGDTLHILYSKDDPNNCEIVELKK